MSESNNNSNVIAAVAYLWILFFLPLVVNPQDSFGRYHANQALILFIVSTLGTMILGIIPFLGWIILPFFGIACFILMVLGMINAFQGLEKPLPFIGGFTLIK